MIAGLIQGITIFAKIINSLQPSMRALSTSSICKEFCRYWVIQNTPKPLGSQIRISGRMEEIAPGIIVDVSHNIQGMQGFVQTVEANYHGMKKRILFAASHQNEEEYMKNILKTIPEIEAFYTVGIHKRRIDEAEFQDAFRKMIDRNQETTVCFVVGSFYLAGMAKEFINQEEENVRL